MQKLTAHTRYQDKSPSITDNLKLNFTPIFTSQMKTSIILNAAFKGNTEAKSVKNHDDAYIAVWNPYDKESYISHYLNLHLKM